MIPERRREEKLMTISEVTKTFDTAVHLIVTFKNKADLLSCYDKMKEGSITIDPLEELPYSPLAVQFIDKFGVQWGFMVI